MEERTEFGFKRTFAEGPFERLNCKFIPGMLVPADLDRMARAMGFDDTKAWAMEHLLASPGATMMRIDSKTGKGETYRVPTLVPARKGEHRHCMHFDENGRCNVHAVAPFGCAFFDGTQSEEEHQKRSIAAHDAIKQAWETNSEYAQIWTMLSAAGKKAPEPRECREEMKKAVVRLVRKGAK